MLFLSVSSFSVWLHKLLLVFSSLTEEKLEEGNDGLDYFISNFGEEYTMKLVIDNNLIDINRASKDAVATDGIAHFLSYYDGETLYLSDDCVAYRTN